jgi:hypothetical protein
MLTEPGFVAPGERGPDQLLHRTAHLGEVAVEDRPEDLGIVGLSERGRADEVAEQHGDELAYLARGGRCTEGCGALHAVLGALRIRVTAGGADRHTADATGWTTAPLIRADRSSEAREQSQA